MDGLAVYSGHIERPGRRHGGHRRRGGIDVRYRVAVRIKVIPRSAGSSSPHSWTMEVWASECRDPRQSHHFGTH